MRLSAILTALFFVLPSLALADSSSRAVISEAPALVPVPSAEFRSDPTQFYRAIFDSREAGKTPSDLAPAIAATGADLNALVASGVPASHIELVIDFHAPSVVSALLVDSAYREKFGVANPNLPVLAKLRVSGVKLYVSAQVVIGQKIAFESLSPDVALAEDGLVVLTNYQNRGYALMLY